MYYIGCCVTAMTKHFDKHQGGEEKGQSGGDK